VEKVDTYDRVRRALDQSGPGTSDFDLNPADARRENRTLRPAAVLLALLDTASGPRVILTKRSSALKHHPGQIAFPGGKVERGDGGAVRAALREADEEIGLHRGNVEVFGTLPPHETVTGFGVTPVVARVRRPFGMRPEPGEVAEVFSVPFSHVAEPANFQVQYRFWRGRRRCYFTVPYGPYYIWGATARILRGLAERLAP